MRWNQNGQAMELIEALLSTYIDTTPGAIHGTIYAAIYMVVLCAPTLITNGGILI